MHWRCALTFRRQMHHVLSFKIFHRILSWNSIKQQLCIFIDGIQWTVLGLVIMMQVGRDGEPLPGQQVVISDNTGGRLCTIETRDKHRPSVSWDWPNPAPPTPAAHAPTQRRSHSITRCERVSLIQTKARYIQINIGNMYLGHCQLLCQKMHKSECPGRVRWEVW